MAHPESASRMTAAAAMSLAAVMVCSGAAAMASAGHPGAPPPGHTGGFGEPTCAVCHIGSELNAFGGSVRLEGVPERYAPGAGYPLTVVLLADETATAGFQMAARFADGPNRGRPAGTFLPLDGRVAITAGEGGGRYLHQTASGATAASSQGSSWTFEWRAPAAAAGPVVFHVAANSGNGDNSPLGDLVYRTEVRSDPPGPSR